MHEKSKQGYKCQICSYETKFKKEFQVILKTKCGGKINFLKQRLSNDLKAAFKSRN